MPNGTVERQLRKKIWSIQPDKPNKDSCGDYYCYICIKEFFDFKNSEEFVCMSCNSKCHCHKCKNKEFLIKQKKILKRLQTKLNQLKVPRADPSHAIDDTSFLREMLLDTVINIPKQQSSFLYRHSNFHNQQENSQANFSPVNKNLQSTVPSNLDKFDHQLNEICFKSYYKMRDFLHREDYLTREGPWSEQNLLKANLYNSDHFLYREELSYLKINPVYFQNAEHLKVYEERELLLRVARAELTLKPEKATREQFLSLFSIRGQVKSIVALVKLMKEKAHTDLQFFNGVQEKPSTKSN